ncbi:MAG: M61 family metallopeptidase, partial [Fidelibacterota bacterium]
VPHHYAIDGEGNYDSQRLLTDTGKIFTEIHNLFGSIPYEDYTIFLQLRDGRRGGLEHLNSTHLLTSRWAFSPDSEYREYLELLAHELFHTYNVKRIKPESFDQYDYERENYTDLLWIAEGLTSYYERLLLRRADLITVETYLDLLAAEIQEIESTPGRTMQTLQEASFDAWIKYYRPNASSPNTTVSYYTKGSLVGLALDLSLRSATQGEAGLDDVFRMLWQRYREDNSGYTYAAFQAVCDTIAGQPLDDVFRYVSTTEEINWEPILEPFGLLLVRSHSTPEYSAQAYYGFQTREKDGRLIVSRVDHDTPATRAGLSVRDELVSIDGYRLLGRNTQEILDSRKQDQEVTMVVTRDGLMRTLKIRPQSPPYDMVSIVRVEPPTEEQEALYSGWLQASWE